MEKGNGVVIDSSTLTLTGHISLPDRSQASSLKIVDLKTTIVAIPLKGIHPSSLDVIGRTPCVSVIVEVRTDSGLVGVGESPVITTAEICKLMIDSVKPQMLGEDPFMIERPGHQELQCD